MINYLRIIFLISFIPFMTYSCAMKNEAVSEKNIDNQIGGIEVQDTFTPSKKTSDITPESFERAIPESTISLSSLTIFEYGYDSLYYGSGLIDFATDDNVIVLLSEDQIVSNVKTCQSLHLNYIFNKIYPYKSLIIVYNYSTVEVYSLKECGKLASYSRALNGDIKVVDDVLIEYESSRVVLRELLTGKQITTVETDLEIATAGEFEGKISLIHKNGFITYYDQKVNSFLLDTAVNLNFAHINYINSSFYGVTNNGSFFTVINDKTTNYEDKNCYISSGSVAAICNTKLLYNGQVYENVPNMGKFIAGKDVFITFNPPDFQMYKLIQAYQKKVQFDYILPTLCRTPNNSIYFKDFSGRSRKVVNKIESATSNIPKSCKPNAKLYIENGDFVCDDNDCGTFSERIVIDEATSRYKRLEENKIFYYYNK